MPAGDWPKAITDCTDEASCGEDRDPEAGKFSLKGIPWGTYELTETKAPDGYVVAAEPVRFTVGSEQLNVDEWTYEIGNVANYEAGAGLTWQKVDPKGERLKGAEWQLVPLDENEEPIAGAEPIDVTDCVADSEADCEGIDQSPEGGVFTLASVAPGNYHLIETKAPAGFQKLTAPILVTIAGDTAVDLGEIENRQVEVPVLPLTGGLGTLIFVIVGGLLLAFTLFFAVRTIRARRLT
nr:LPXTG cell wall anchor domain-containing protein [Leucobacter chinensis]